MNNQKKVFYPDYLSEIIFSVAIAFEILIILALLYYPSIGRQIDFSRPFQPKPEWYFLWLYELVKYFHGKIIFIGTFVIPLFFIIMLISIPFIDRGKYGRLKAILAFSMVFVSIISLILINLL